MRLRIALIALGCLAQPQAWAQEHAQDIVTVVAEDVFGTSFGLQSVGLYSPTDARGFSPQQAGNLRIEGLYFDQESANVGSCIVRQTTMRIGIAAQTYSMPAPTGIADYTLRIPGDQWAFSGTMSRGPFTGATFQLEAQMPIEANKLSADVCVANYLDVTPDNDRHDDWMFLGTTLRWQPVIGTEVVPFWSSVQGGDREVLPTVYTNGAISIPMFRERDLETQPWSSQGWQMRNFGVVSRSTFSDHWKLATGLFHSQEHDPPSYYPYLELTGGRLTDSVLDVPPAVNVESSSGEMRLVGTATYDKHQQIFEVSLRGRSVRRSFGGDDTIDFGNVTLSQSIPALPPALNFTATSLDRVRELDVGSSYEERWQGVGSIAFGIIQENYRRTITIPGIEPATDRLMPWRINSRFTVVATRDLLFYGSYTQGLEDSAIAPSNAINRGEPPAASRTWQVDGGLKYTPLKDLQLILGGFRIDKPYINLDTADVYRPLGRIQSSGIETSLSYEAGGFTLLAGGVLLKPRIDSSVPQSQIIGTEPLGPVPLTLTVNLDVAPPAWGPWAAGMALNWLSSRPETLDDQMSLPPLTTLDANIRHRWKWADGSATLSLGVTNLLNTHGLRLTAPYFIVWPEPDRAISLTLTTDL
jgi:iron complex outermembrane receptor protein